MTAVSEIMTADVYTAQPTTTVAEVAEAMVRGRFGSAVVGDPRMILGIFTERDVLRAAAAGTDPTASKISDWMTGDPITAERDTDAQEAAEMMLAGGFRHLPVVEGNRLVGIVSLRDVLSARIGRR